MRTFYTTLMLCALVGVGGFACNKKSSKKGANAAEPVDETENKPVDSGNTVTVTPATTTVTTLAGLRCDSEKITNGSDQKTIILDTTGLRMQITSSAGQQDYVLSNPKKFFGKTKYTITPAAGGSDTGSVIMDDDTKFLGRDNGARNGYMQGVPYSLSGGTGKSLTGWLACK